jgi:hypothetical protein
MIAADDARNRCFRNPGKSGYINDCWPPGQLASTTKDETDFTVW